MSATPFHQLVIRHLCRCPTVAAASRVSRRTFTWSPSHAHQQQQHWTPGAGAYGSAELLKRRYQKLPPATQEPKPKPEHGHLKKRIRRSAYGIGACAVGLVGTIYLFPTEKKTTHLDAAPPLLGALDAPVPEEIEQVATGTSTIPTFPKQIFLSETPTSPDPSAAATAQREYQLVGLGIRTVFYVEVYVVGLYVAVADVAKLQERLIRSVNPIATTLVPEERKKLKEMLLDPVKGLDIWNSLLKDEDVRMAIRIVPTRNTDFVHLRDGWVRGITAKTQFFSSLNDQSFSDESFGVALNEFKTVLGGGFRKKVPWGETIVLTRDGDGVLNSWYEDQKGNRVNLGLVKDERISRLLWLIYLGGKQVSSEPLRQSVINGVMEYVERPVGTVATQVA